MDLFAELGFRWDRGSVSRDIPSRSVELAVFQFHKNLPQHIWEMGVLAGNPLSFAEVKAVSEGMLPDGPQTVEQQQIVGISAASRRLRDQVRSGTFRPDEGTLYALNRLLLRHEGNGTQGNGGYQPPHDGSKVFAHGVVALERQVTAPFERGAAFFLFGVLQRFVPAGAELTSLLMMSGILMSAGIDPVSISRGQAVAFNAGLEAFRESHDGSGIMGFLAGRLRR